MQSEPVSPPPITTTFLPVARMSARADRLAGVAAVLLRQEIHREMHAGELAAGDRQIARRFGAAGQRDGVILFQQLLRIDRAGGRAADRGIVVEDDAFAFHLRHPAVDQAASPS